MRLTSIGAALLVAGCGGSLQPIATPPSPVSAPPTPEALAAGAPSSPALPPVPRVTGPLAPRVVYPSSNALIQSRDSNFIFGSIGNGNAALTINGTPVHVWPNGAYLAWLPVPTADAPRYDLVATLGPDTTAAPRLTADTTPVYVALGAVPDSVPADTDRVIIGRPVPRGTYKWFLLPGTVLRQVAREGDFAKVRLDAALDIWVAAADAITLPAGVAEPGRVVGNARVVPGADYVDLVLPIGARPAYDVEESGSDVVLTLYGTKATTDIINYRANDPMVRTVEWMQETNDRARY